MILVTPQLHALKPAQIIAGANCLAQKSTYGFRAQLFRTVTVRLAWPPRVVARPICDRFATDVRPICDRFATDLGSFTAPLTETGEDKHASSTDEN